MQLYERLRTSLLPPATLLAGAQADSVEATLLLPQRPRLLGSIKKKVALP